MHEAATSSLEAWGNFYVIVGSSAGALTGLQFVVMTLIAQTGLAGRGDALSAFGTPNVVHFCAALLVASLLTIPWPTLTAAGLTVAGAGAVGTLYSVTVLRRARRQKDYQPVFEDWLWHTILPFVAYALMMIAGGALARNSAAPLFVIGASALFLVFIGIHNSWDTVVYITQRQAREERADP